MMLWQKLIGMTQRRHRVTEYHGHLTHVDGSHTPLTEDAARAICASVEAARKRSAEEMPDTYSALNARSRANERLSDLGWRSGHFAPRDGSVFAVIERAAHGCGIFEAYADAEYLWYCGDPHQHDKLLWKPIADLSEADRTHMAVCMEKDREAHDAEMDRYAAASEASYTMETSNGS